ncbi:MAG: crossover junction endodeoxyribonuclease RuvC [Candidatus Neomarinimicrobiota bacterium]|nr:crossover junction endodeoxyribonuclease RuvC [Candidatus Neomarinimicrobiota bacterium]MEC8706378.1 crossover junction endodeoxyribonuclease RuvC [Candidatus Neomarinimicrobiota bacterium]
MNKINRIIGVDPGLNKTGFGILDYKGSQVKTVAYGLISPPSKESLPNRLEYLHSHMNELIDKFQPITMAIEDSFYSQNVKSAILLGQARGVLLLSAASKGIPSMVYAPRKVKQSVTGSGSASKEQIKYMVEKILNVKKTIKSNDISDALAVGLCHINQNKYL